jgi:hypothetical protein
MYAVLFIDELKSEYMASNCIAALRSITARANKPLSTSTKKSSFYWCGFKSHRGASKMSVVAARLARLNSHQQARPPPPAMAGPASQQGGGRGGRGNGRALLLLSPVQAKNT